MTTVDNIQNEAGRLSPADVHGVLFTRAGIGRRGYVEAEVDAFLDRVYAEITRLIAEKGELRDEVSRLRSRLEGGEDAVMRDEASVQAVRVLSAAQQTADQYVAEAEHYSRRVTSDARQQAEEMIAEARRRASVALEEAERLAARAEEAAASATAEAAENGGRTRQELEEQVAYLKAFGQVCRTQLRSYLEALLRDVENEWGRVDPAVAMAQRAVPQSRQAEDAPSSDGEKAPTTAEDDGAPATEARDQGNGDQGNGAQRGSARHSAASRSAKSRARDGKSPSTLPPDGDTAQDEAAADDTYARG